MNKYLPIIVLALTAVAFPSVAQDDKPQETKVSEMLGQKDCPHEVRIFTLQYLPATEAVNLISQLVSFNTNIKTRLVADTRSNRVIASGSVDQLELVEQLLVEMDVQKKRPKNKPDQEYFKSYSFQDQQSLESSFEVLQSMLSGMPGVKMDMDQTGLKLYLQGTDNHHAKAKALFDHVKNSVSDTLGKNIHITTVLIVDTFALEEEELKLLRLKELNGKLSKALKTASEKGLIDMPRPMIASRVTSLVQSARTGSSSHSNRGNTNTQLAGAFGNKSSGYFSLSNSGVLTQISAEKFKLQSNVTVKVASHLQIEEASPAEISSNIELPLDHPVLLSFSSISGFDSVVVIMLSSN